MYRNGNSLNEEDTHKNGNKKEINKTLHFYLHCLVPFKWSEKSMSVLKSLSFSRIKEFSKKMFLCNNIFNAD